MRRLIAILIAALALAMPAGAFAASTSETFASVVTITLTGVPTTLDYGTVSPAVVSQVYWPGGIHGGQSSGAGDTSKLAPIVFGADSGTPIKLYISGTDLSRSGGGIYSNTNRRYCTNNAAPTGGTWDASSSCQTGAATYGTTALDLASQSAVGTNASAILNVGWMVNNLPAGSYTGTITFTAS